LKRRELIALIGGVVVARPTAATAQQSAGMRKIGVLDANAANEHAQRDRLFAFKQRLQELGWMEGQTVHFDVRYADGKYDRLPDLATGLLSSSPDVILAVSTFALAALKASTQSVPIVFVRVPDPVGLGFVKSLARPDGNITGFAFYDFAMGTKWFELLRDIAPRTARVVVLSGAKGPSTQGFLRSIGTTAKLAKVEVIAAPVQARNRSHRQHRFSASRQPGSSRCLTHSSDFIGT